jgi:hypothetical protein
MIPWVDEQCRIWGAHRRWMELGEDGWPERSLLGKLIAEGAGAGHVGFSSRVPIKDPPPAYTAITLALRSMADTHVMELPRQVVFVHYLFRGKAKGKSLDLGISLPHYWRQLHAAHAFIVGHYVPREASYTRELACA